MQLLMGEDQMNANLHSDLNHTAEACIDRTSLRLSSSDIVFRDNGRAVLTSSGIQDGRLIKRSQVCVMNCDVNSRTFPW